MEDEDVTAIPDVVELPGGKLMPIWALYIEVGEVEQQHPDWSKDQLIEAARDLYIERHR